MKHPESKKRILLTGSEGMLGRYLRRAFAGCEIVGLNRRATPGGIECDLTQTTPQLGDEAFDLVIHAAGTRDNDQALSLNLEGTRRLLKALDAHPPRKFIFISDAAVHGLDATDICEETPTRTADKTGQSKFLAEQEIAKWAEARGVLLTVLRPAPMFGSGISGEMARLFADVARARYIHVRGNDARRGIVTALDVARSAVALADKGGTYIVADGYNRPLIDLVEAMSANASVRKRMVYLPEKWAAVGGRIPGLKRILDPETLRRRAVSVTFRPDKLIRETGLTLFDTVEVIARRDPGYPYEDR